MTRQLPQFIGNIKRLETICEDIPVGTIILELNSYDPTHCGLPLCYSIVPNDYFKLTSDQEPSISGLVVLKKSLDLKTIKQQNPNGTINISALLSYCNQPNILREQLIVFTVLGVNKYAPVVLQQVFKLNKLILTANE